VEGRARFGAREFLRFVRIAAASLAEVEYLLFYAYEERYLSKKDYAQLNDLQRRTTTLVYRLARSLWRGAE
jgi:four helix bundle protein